MMPPSLDLLFPEPVDAIAATWIRACDEEFLSPNRPGFDRRPFIRAFGKLEREWTLAVSQEKLTRAIVRHSEQPSGSFMIGESTKVVLEREWKRALSEGPALRRALRDVDDRWAKALKAWPLLRKLDEARAEWDAVRTELAGLGISEHSVLCAVDFIDRDIRQLQLLARRLGIERISHRRLPGSLRRSPAFGDRVVRLYDLLAPRVKPARRSLSWGQGPVPSVFNQRVLELVARTINALSQMPWAGCHVSAPLTAADVKARVRRRARAR